VVIWSLLSIFGLWCAHRTLLSLEDLQLFPGESLSKVRIVIFLMVIALNFLLREHFFLLWGIHVVIFLSPGWWPAFIQRRRELRVKRERTAILDFLIQSLCSGQGFRAAIRKYSQICAPPTAYMAKEFLSVLEYQKPLNELATEPQLILFFQELEQVDRSAHKTIDRLKALRRKLLMEKNFRQKSRQALLQVRFQSWIISGMYLFLLFYIHLEFGLARNKSLIFVSISFFTAGLLWVQKMGRTYRWKL